MGHCVLLPATVDSRSLLPDQARAEGVTDAALVGAQPIGNVFTMENHDGAYYAWKQAGIKGRILVHVDAHLDWDWVPDRDPLEILQAESLTQINSLLQERHLWNLARRKSEELVHIGNYLCPALSEGIVKELYWVLPDVAFENLRLRRAIVRKLQRLISAHSKELINIRLESTWIVGEILGRPLTACSLSDLPRLQEPVLLDIDTDFLMGDSDEICRSGDNPWRQLPWMWPDELIESLSAKPIRADFVTIAYSVEGGFTPLSYKYLGDVLAQRFKDPIVPQRNRELLALKRAGARYRSQKDPVQAIAAFEAAVALAPEDASSHFDLAYLHDQQGAHVQAAACYQQALQLDGAYATAYNNFGPVYHDLGMLHHAQDEYERILTWDPQHADARFGLAEILAQQERWEEAISQYRMAVAFGPNHTRAHCGLGYVSARCGLWDEAIIQFQRSIALQPCDVRAYCWLSEAYSHQKRWDEAIEACRCVLRCGARHARIHQRLGGLYLRTRRFYKAWRQYRQAVRLWGWSLSSTWRKFRKRATTRLSFGGGSPVFTFSSRFSKNGKIPWRIIEQEAILIDLDEGEVVRLNPVGAEIWNAIDGTRTANDIVDHVCRTFDVSQWRARRDVRRFIKQLLRHDLVEERPTVSTA